MRTALGDLFEELDAGRPVAIGYLGGAGAAGEGASDPTLTSWRARTTAWFRQQFPRSEFREINATLAGTASDLGAFRCGHDLLDHKPDLVFVEFALEDAALSEDRIIRSMEGIVRQIWENRPAAPIVFIYAAREDMAEHYRNVGLPPSIVAHERIGMYYGIRSVNVGRALLDKIIAEETDWYNYTVDGSRPNDLGHDFYADELCTFLQTQPRTGGTPIRDLPEPYASDCFDDGCLIDAWNFVAADGFRRDEAPLAEGYPHRLAADTPGSELIFYFEGDVIGLYWLSGPDTGDIEWSVDGAPPQRLSTWDNQSFRSTHLAYAILQDHLPVGGHELLIRVLPVSDPRAGGNSIYLGAFLCQAS